MKQYVQLGYKLPNAGLLSARGGEKSKITLTFHAIKHTDTCDRCPLFPDLYKTHLTL